MKFGKKLDTQELEEKLNSCQQQFDELVQKVNKAKEIGKDSASCFESQIASQSEMDKQLTKVVGYAHQSIATSKESQRAVEKMSADIVGLREQIEEEEAKKRRLVEDMDGCFENLLYYAGEVKKTEQPIKVLEQAKQNLQEDFQKVGEVVNDMKEFSKQMGVLCLHNAVEAGRLGEAGRPVVESVQKVRQYADKYEKASVQMSDLLEQMEKRVKKMEKQMEALSVMPQSDINVWKNLSEKIEKQLNVCGEISQNRFSDKLYLFSSEIRMLLDNQEAIQSLQKNTLSEMENIGGSFMDEQEARKELERIFEKVMKSME